ncbi:AMP-binding protein [bacterium]|nr:AMP-binding protein [bacterium]
MQSEPDPILAVVRELACELNPGHSFENLGESAHLEYDLGLGSLERLELTRRLEVALQTRLKGEVVLQARICGDLYAILEGQASAQPVPQACQLTGARPVAALASAETMVEVLVRRADAQPDREVLVWLDEGRPRATRTYAQLVQEASAAAGGLAARGVQSGDRVGIMLPTGTEFVASFFGTLMLGAVPVPLYPPFRPDQVEEHVRRQGAILQSAGVRVLVVFPQMLAAARLLHLNTPSLNHVVPAGELVRHAPVPSRPTGAETLALIQYTSGSTGLPKGVMLSHDNLLANIRAYRRGLEVSPSDVCVSWLPLYHDMGLIGAFLGGIYHGVPLVLMGPQDFLARPSRWLWAIHQYRGSISAAPNFAYELCARKLPESELEGLDLSSWRVALNGAESVRPDTLTRFSERFAAYGWRPQTFLPVYGLAEATLAVSFPPVGRLPLIDEVDRHQLEAEGRAWPARPGHDSLRLVSCGRPLDKIEIRVVNEGGRPLDERRVGRLQFRGPSSLRGYYANPQATARIVDKHGWVDTEDRAYLADGELYLVGRHKNVILKAGRNLHAEDIEEAAFAVEGVRRGCVAAFALADEESGSELIVVVLETRAREPEEKKRLEAAVKRQITEAVGLAPDRVVLVPPGSVPKTPSGKIRRPDCRDRYLAGTLGQRRGTAAQALALVSSGLARQGRRLLTMPARALYSAGWGLGLVGLASLVALTGRLNRPAARRLASKCCRVLLKCAGVELEIRGELPTTGACVVVANHTSRFDPLLLLAAWPQPLHFVVAPWVARGPLGPLMAPLEYLAVERGKALDLDPMQQILRQGGCLAAFPEGGLEHAPGLRPFTLGVFHVAAREDQPVVTVALDGARDLMPGRWFVPRPGRVRITIGSAMRADNNTWSEVVALSLRARQAIAAHCGEALSERRLRRED